MRIQQRRDGRHLVPANVICVSSYAPRINGWLKDIGVDGLAFEYSSLLDLDSDWLEIDIFANSRLQVRVTGISCRVIYDIRASEAAGFFKGRNLQCYEFGRSHYTIVEPRICGVKFTGLSPAKRDQLNMLMNKLINNGLVASGSAEGLRAPQPLHYH